jgi:hypothetical protein
MKKLNKEKNNTVNTQNSCDPEKQPHYLNHKGRFVGLKTRSSRGEKSYCAKIIRITENYVTFLNVNDQSLVKVSKNSII